jgi:3-hydroxy-3-methylglutaryl CoA synthase
VLALAGLQKEDVDYYVFHQANKFILEHLGRKMKLPEGRAPLDLEKWGNTSSASVPLTICDKLGAELKKGSKRLCLAGFGVGWSWSAAVIDIGPLAVADVYEMPDDYPCGSEPLTDGGYFKERKEKELEAWKKYMREDRFKIQEKCRKQQRRAKTSWFVSLKSRIKNVAKKRASG